MVLNFGSVNKNVEPTVRGTPATSFSATRSSENGRYADVGIYSVIDSVIFYEAPAQSVKTFFAVRQTSYG